MQPSHSRSGLGTQQHIRPQSPTVAWEVARSRTLPSGLVEEVRQLRASDSLNATRSLLLTLALILRASESCRVEA